MNSEIALARANTERNLQEGLAQEASVVEKHLRDLPKEVRTTVAILVGDDRFRALVSKNHNRRQLLDSLPKGD